MSRRMGRKKGPRPLRVQVVLTIHPLHGEMLRRVSTTFGKAPSVYVADLIEKVDEQIRAALSEEQRAQYDEGLLDYATYWQAMDRARHLEAA